MKVILAGVAFATLLTPSVFAQAPQSEGWPASGTSMQHNRQFRGDSENLYFNTQPMPNPESMQQELCDTAHDFCNDFHGDNG